MNLHERGFDGIEVDVRSPLHPIEREELSLVRHGAELNNLDSARELFGELRQTLADFIDGDGMNEARSRWVSEVRDPVAAPRFVPILRGTKT